MIGEKDSQHIYIVLVGMVYIVRFLPGSGLKSALFLFGGINIFIG